MQHARLSPISIEVSKSTYPFVCVKYVRQIERAVESKVIAPVSASPVFAAVAALTLLDLIKDGDPRLRSTALVLLITYSCLSPEKHSTVAYDLNHTFR